MVDGVVQEAGLIDIDTDPIGDGVGDIGMDLVLVLGVPILSSK